MKIYVASSWRNEHQPSVVRALRAIGHDVYDFRNPAIGEHGFSWSKISIDWKTWTPKEYVDKVIDHPISVASFKYDMDALDWCDICVLLLPCGNSSHLEAGYAKGKNKKLYIVLSKYEFVPDLMYRMADGIMENISVLYKKLERMSIEPKS